MNIKSVDYIITAKHISSGSSLSAYFKEQADNIRYTRGANLLIDEKAAPQGLPIKARIYQGQWIADCECNGASYVDPDDRRFFCFSCGNRANEGKPRPVIFPDNYQDIERMILERPVNDIAGITDAERATLAKPLIFVEGKGGLSRNWMPHETLKDLEEQQSDAIKKWHKQMKEK